MRIPEPRFNTRCTRMVMTGGYHQCHNKRVVGEHCKIHSPEGQKARWNKRDARRAEEFAAASARNAALAAARERTDKALRDEPALREALADLLPLAKWYVMDMSPGHGQYKEFMARLEKAKALLTKEAT